jgi:excisionase family DNA binding protein
MATRTSTVTAYSLTEASKRLGLSRQTLWRAVKAGKLPVTKSGNAVIVYADDLLDYVLAHRDGKVVIEA